MDLTLTRVKISEWWAKVNEILLGRVQHHPKCHFDLAAVHLPLRMRADLDGSRAAANTMQKLSGGSDSVDMVSDEFDSDSKENENVSNNDQLHD